MSGITPGTNAAASVVERRIIYRLADASLQAGIMEGHFWIELRLITHNAPLAMPLHPNALRRAVVFRKHWNVTESLSLWWRWLVLRKAPPAGGRSADHMLLRPL
ncbi:hypothetical protein TRVL_07889 [Trypanosoma vivax]|nr:hypothetical protein TRVL_07889 [Trypanosoma vivax]